MVSAANHLLHKNPDPVRLKKRIEKDGVITLSEAKKWYKHGGGLALKADFSKVFPSDFAGNTEKYINLFFKGGKDALVYGSIKLKYMGNNIVESASGYDIYDFKYDGRLVRDIFTGLGRLYNGPGKEFRINFYGGGAYIGKSSPYSNPCIGNQCGRN